jgi:D-tyrosyl-tRNA(Tyr) deacylase
MRILIQRCRRAAVRVNQETVGQIEHGFVLLVGIGQSDTKADAEYLADKIVNLRIFEDDQDKMNISIKDVGGAILSVSQFTLHADCRKGRRPNFMGAAAPDEAQALYEYFNEQLRAHGIDVQTGRFGAMMDVELCNWGPVTIWLDSHEMKSG